MAIDDNLKDEQKKAIAELQKRMKNEIETEPELLSDNYFLLKFLKAQSMNLDNAEKMLRKSLEWRKNFDVKNILKMERIEIPTKYVPFSFIGYDKEGYLVRYCPVGNLDLHGVMSSCTPEEMEKYIIYEMETEMPMHKAQSKKLGKNIDKSIYIHNYENLSFAQATDKKNLHIAIMLMVLYVNNYPGRLKSAYLINTPVYFSIFFSIMKAFLSASIMRRIRIYSDDSYKEDLLKVIDADVLPKFLGGNRTDPDGNPLCLSFINHAGEKVPESCYINNKKQPLSQVPGVEKVTVERASFHEINLEVKEPGSYLEWEFETKCRDIGFGLFYQEIVDGEEKITEIIPIQRIDTEEYPETGTVRCEEAGTYVIVFDNTYSVVRSKEIFFRTKVVTPKEHESEMND